MIDGARFNRRFAELFTEQTNWVENWRQISKNIMPKRGNFSEDMPNQGKRNDQTILDGTPIRAARTLAAGMQSGLTSPARPWFKIGVADPKLVKLQEVRVYLDEVQQRMAAIFSRSNIYNSLHSTYEEIGTFGTAALIIVEDFDEVIRAKTFTIGEYAIACGHDGRVNTFARYVYKTVGQMVDEFVITGKDANGKPIYDWSKVSQSVRSQHENGKIGGWVKIKHLIEANDDRDPTLPDVTNKLFRSIYREEGSAEGVFLKISGFDEFPVMAPRWDVIGNDWYGKSPGWDALGDAKQLHTMESDKLQALDKSINPPLDVPSSMRRYGVNILPGGINWRDDANPQNGIRPAYQITPDMQGIIYAIEDKRKAIGEAFYTDMFKMLAEADGPQMTAREVVERHEEKLLMLGPVLEQLEDELLDPLIARTYGIMNRMGLLPDPPEVLQKLGAHLKVEYVSMLAQAQKMVGTTGLQQGMSFVGNLAGVFPSILDKVDSDEVVDQYFDMLGLPPGILRSDVEVQKVRDGKAQQQQQAMAAQMGLQAAQGAKTLSEANMQENNALTALMGGPK